MKTSALITFIVTTLLATPSLALELPKGTGVVMFWRADCAPCRREIAILPEIARANPALHITLIALQDEAPSPTLPENVELLVADEDGKTILESFGNTTHALPFSVALHGDGSVCERHYGILGTERVKKWGRQC